MILTEDMEKYLRDSEEELKDLLRQLCQIPAPSHHEEKRAEFCLNWFHANGGTEAYIDEALNVICPYHVTEDNDLVQFNAHTDTVFPDLEPMPMVEENGRLHCPGVCDDTADLAILMLCARYVMQNKLDTKTGILFVANSCEEGLGNLKGTRAVCRKYGSRIREFVALDDNHLNCIVNRAVGSHRYKITARTEGGHSFNAFGNRNAIHVLASLINSLYTVKVPQEGDSHTTYNVGMISGGTSVNTIAQEASMLYEYRSDDKKCMDKMQHMLDSMVEAYRATGVEIQVEQIGERPCAGDVDPVRYEALVSRACETVRQSLGQEPCCLAGSTDCNIPLSLGIPSVCIGVCTGQGCHTRAEVLELDSLYPGSRRFMAMLGEYLA